MKTKSVFWGSLFMGAGFLLLLDNLGILNVNVWNLIWPTFIIAMGVWTLLVASRGKDALEVDDLSIPLEGTQMGALELSFGAGQVKITSETGADELLQGSFAGGVTYSNVEKRGRQTVSLKPTTEDIILTMMPWTWGAREWDFGLSKNVDWKIHLEMGASDMQVDLSDLNVSELEVDTGASNTKIILPANAGHTRVELSGGAASITFEVPEGVAASIHLDSGLAAIDIDRERFPRMGNVYQSADYETAVNKVDIDADFGAGSLSIR